MKIGTFFFVVGTVSWVTSIVLLIFSPITEQILIGGTAGFVSGILLLSFVLSKTFGKTIGQRIKYFS